MVKNKGTDNRLGDDVVVSSVRIATTIQVESIDDIECMLEWQGCATESMSRKSRCWEALTITCLELVT